MSGEPAMLSRNSRMKRYESSSEESRMARMKQKRGIATRTGFDSDFEGNLSITKGYLIRKDEYLSEHSTRRAPSIRIFRGSWAGHRPPLKLHLDLGTNILICIS